MWKEIILIAVIAGLFIFFFCVLYNAFLKKSKATSAKEPEKAEKKDEPKQETIKTEDIPKVIKDVTEGNYMYDLSQEMDLVGEVEMPENVNISPTSEGPKQKTVEEAFDYISEIEDGFQNVGEEMDDLVEDNIDDVNEYFDDIQDIDVDDDLQIEEEEKEIKKVKVENKIVKEYKGLSKEMKTILIANILEKKHK